ncbi:21029_t:CDS:1 [Entrophospora sp. SA101]|nr:9875_t:CDS:1 [Entrophospora sp. SA101]CAJ0746996.1 21029_t:CDS:1 [Entrophospora sp. SA101]CAJ0908572.1 13456_t:CDS:1 [Entrophospora sp. SA101]
MKPQKSKIINKTATGLPIYECINKTTDGKCKSLQVGKKGSGLVLQKGDQCFDCQFAGLPYLQTNSNSTQLLVPKSPHRRSRSFGNLTTQPSEDSDLMSPTNSNLRRRGAISKTKNEEEDNDSNLNQSMTSDGSEETPITVTNLALDLNELITTLKDFFIQQDTTELIQTKQQLMQALIIQQKLTSENERLKQQISELRQDKL